MHEAIYITRSALGTPSSAEFELRRELNDAQIEEHMEAAGCRAGRELRLARAEAGPDAADAVAYAMVVTAIGHFVTEWDIARTYLLIQETADRLAVHLAPPNPRLDA